MSEIIKTDNEYVANTYARFPVVPKEGVLYMNMSNFVIAEKENPMDMTVLMQDRIRHSR